MESRAILSDTVLKKLEALVLSLHPGDKLPTEKELAEKYAVGRSTIRESLKVLSARKLILRRNEGTFVAETVSDCLVDPLNLIINMDIGNLSDLVELRELLECTAVQLAADRATEESIANLEHIDWLLQEPGAAPEQLQQRDFAFHDALAKSSGNAVLAELLKAIRQVIAQNLEDSAVSRNLLDESVSLHKKMIAAIRSHDKNAAIAYMQEYLITMDDNA